jgi:hypothetical protein
MVTDSRKNSAACIAGALRFCDETVSDDAAAGAFSRVDAWEQRWHP